MDLRNGISSERGLSGSNRDHPSYREVRAAGDDVRSVGADSLRRCTCSIAGEVREIARSSGIPGVGGGVV